MLWHALKVIAGGLVALIAAALIVFLCLDTPADWSATTSDPAGAASRFAIWLFGHFTGNLGVSSSASAPVGALIAGRLAVTLPLIGLGLVVTALSAAALGYAATRGMPWLDRGMAALSRLLGLIPGFWLGMLLVMLFALTLHWLPNGGFVPWTSNLPLALVSLVMPALTLGLPVGALLALRIRDAIVEARGAPYVTVARLRGMTPAAAFRAHGVRHVVLALLSAAGPLAMSLAAGSVIVETVFYLPGLGRLMLDAVAARDATVVKSAILVLMTISVALYIALRLATGWADPRISHRAPA